MHNSRVSHKFSIHFLKARIKCLSFRLGKIASALIFTNLYRVSPDHSIQLDQVELLVNQSLSDKHLTLSFEVSPKILQRFRYRIEVHVFPANINSFKLGERNWFLKAVLCNSRLFSCFGVNSGKVVIQRLPGTVLKIPLVVRKQFHQFLQLSYGKIFKICPIVCRTSSINWKAHC